MDASKVSERIAGLPLLSELPAEMRGQVADVFLNVADVYHYEDGEALINAGYLSFDTGYVIVDGVASVELEAGEPVEVKAPAVLGEMAQFRSADLRSATVRAKGGATAIQFYWSDLHDATENQLPEEARQAFRSAIENQIWDRFEYQEIVNLPLFSSMPEDLRKRVCLPFPSIAERVRLLEVDTLFNEGSLCKSTGYLLVQGKLRLFRKDASERIVPAPDMLGIFPTKGEKGTEWTATAMAQGQAEVLKFSWDQYTNRLLKRLTRDERHAFVDSLKENRGKHFWH